MENGCTGLSASSREVVGLLIQISSRDLLKARTDGLSTNYLGSKSIVMCFKEVLIKI